MKVLFKNNEELTRLESLDAFQEYNNCVLIHDVIDKNCALRVISELDYFSRKDPEREIYLMISSPGGSVSFGYMIYDFIKLLPNPVITIGTGVCASMGAFLLSVAGDKRYVTENCELLYHQPLVQDLSGQASDIEIATQHVLNTKSKINKDLSSHSNLEIEQINKIFDRDNWLDHDKAIEYGLIDGILKEYPFKREEYL